MSIGEASPYHTKSQQYNKAVKCAYKTKNSGCYTGVLCFGEIYMKIEDSNLICQHLYCADHSRTHFYSLADCGYIIMLVREIKRIVLCKLDEK